MEEVEIPGSRVVELQLLASDSVRPASLKAPDCHISDDIAVIWTIRNNGCYRVVVRTETFESQPNARASGLGI